MDSIRQIEAELNHLAQARKISSLRNLRRDLRGAVACLKEEDPAVRPADEEGAPGGLVLLNPELPTVVVPDLHARREFLLGTVCWEPEEGRGRVLERLEEGSLQLLCLGDGFHSEKRGYRRWLRSFEEFQGNFRRHKAMDEEMVESYGLMEMVMVLKQAFPRNFHFLKGNHENIRNEEGRGNHPFGKFVYEGEMVRRWVLRFQGEAFMEEYAEMEGLFPYVALGGRFMASHAEPLEYYTPEEVVNIRRFDGIKLGLTWTQNDQSALGTVDLFLREYGRRFGRSLDLYLGGHRTIAGRYRLRAEGRFVQIHNPDRMGVYYARPHCEADPERDVKDIQKKGVLQNEPHTDENW